ncbi:MAG: hypothetical protein AAFW73_14645 [Bacteroidota bacterium]
MEKWTSTGFLALLAAMALMLSLACTRSEILLPRTYVEWVENPRNGLRVEKTIAPLRFDIQYQPVEYLVAQEERRETLPADLLTDRRAEYGDELDYYRCRIAPAAGRQNVLMQSARDEAEYYELIDYFSYAAKEDFYLLHGADTARCVLYQFVRNYELAPHLELALAFERKGKGDRTFVFDDQLLRVGVVKAEIEQQKINQLPQLKTY